MPRIKAIKYIRPDSTVAICSWCPDSIAADEWAANNNYSITHGICENCIDKFKADSIKGTAMEIKIN
jgi:hypothetical protein